MVPFGHAGGSDEMLLVVLPIFVFLAVYRLVRGPLPEEPPPQERG
jgi:hypothetical protein